MYGFMRSGLQGDVDDDTFQLDIMQKTSAIMKVLLEESVTTAARVVKVCGRSTITDDDLKVALMYEAHHLDKDIDTRFVEALDVERQHTYLTDDESDASTENACESDEEGTYRGSDDDDDGRDDPECCDVAETCENSEGAQRLSTRR